MEEVWFKSNGYKLDGIISIPKGAIEKKVPGLIYCSGFAGYKKSRQKIVQGLSRSGYIVFTFDFRGIRKSEGTLDFAAQVDDLKAAITYFLSRKEINNKIIVVGMCLGGAVAICTAAQDQRIKAVAIWDTPVLSQPDLNMMLKLPGAISTRMHGFYHSWHVHGTMGYIKKAWAWAKINPIECISNISPRPLLIIHRKNDIQVPSTYAHLLYEKAKEPKKLIITEGRNHSELAAFFTSTEKKDGAINLTLDWLTCML
jgi:dienelactone hydrolase